MLPYCDVCHSRTMQHQLEAEKDGERFHLRLCYPCFDMLRDIMAIYFLRHDWRDAEGHLYGYALEKGKDYHPMGDS